MRIEIYQCDRCGVRNDTVGPARMRRDFVAHSPPGAVTGESDPDLCDACVREMSAAMKRVDGPLHRRVKDALEVAAEWGGIDGDHHKAWVIDQMVRYLTGCPTVTRTATDARGKTYTYEALGESEVYLEFVRSARDGEDGPETYDWDVGIPP